MEKMAKKKTKRLRWPRELLVWNVTIPVNAALVNGDRRIARSHLVFQLEAHGPSDAFRQLNEYLSQLLDEAQHNTRVRFVPYKRKARK